MKIDARFHDATSTLTYVVHDEVTRDAVVIDPVLDYDPIASQTSTSSAQALLAWIRERGLKVHFILETHAHADHLTAAQFLAHELGAKVVIGEDIRVAGGICARTRIASSCSANVRKSCLAAS